MSLTTILNIATSGVLAQQTAIAATSENIANVTTPDFTRRSVNFSADPVTGQFSGVRADIVRDVANQFLQGAAFSSTADADAAQAVSEALTRIVDSLGRTGDNLSFANQVDEALASLARLGANPSSLAAQTEAVAQLDSALEAFARTRSVIDDEQARAQSSLDGDITQANTILQQIFALNGQIAASGASGGGASSDALSTQLTALASLLPVTVTRDDIGRATVTTTGGRQLVDSTGFATLSASSTGIPTDGQVEITISGLSDLPGALPADTAITDEITGGRIGGNLQLLTTALNEITAAIQEAEGQFVTALNTVYTSNTPNPPASALLGTRQLTDADIAGLAGTSSLALIAADGTLSGRIDVDFTTNQLSVDGGAPLDFSPTVAGFVNGLTTALGINGGINGGVNGSASLVDGQLTISTESGGIALGDDEAGLGGVLGLTPLIVADGTGFRVNDAIIENPALLATGRISLDGVAIGAVVTGANDGRGINALFEAGRGQSNPIAEVIGVIGARANAASDNATSTRAFADSVSAQLLAEGGVNLEEELSNLILFQRSFNANARVIAAVDELYQSVLALI